MGRLTPRPPRLSFLHRRLARLPHGAPTGFACAAAGVACAAGMVFVGPRFGLPLGFPHDGSVRIPAVEGATNAPRPSRPPRPAKEHTKKAPAQAGDRVIPIAHAADEGLTVDDSSAPHGAALPPRATPASTPPPATPAPDEDTHDGDPPATGGRDDDRDAEDESDASHDSDDAGGDDHRHDERTRDGEGEPGSGDEEPPDRGDDGGDSTQRASA